MTFWQTIKSHIQKVPEIWRKTAQALSKATRTTGCNILLSPHRILNGKHCHTENWITKQKPNDWHDGSYKPYPTTAHRDNHNQ